METSAISGIISESSSVSGIVSSSPSFSTKIDVGGTALLPPYNSAISGIISESSSVSGIVSSSPSFSTKIGAGGSALLPPYKGAYIVIPGKNETSIPCENKRMTDNLTITAIPYAEVSNESGGITVSIGS